MKINNRLNEIQEYHFKKIEDIKENLIKSGKNILDLSIGDPDLPVNDKIVKELINATNKKQFNMYPPYEGIKELKIEIIKYYREVFGVNLELDEVLILIGSKEGINNIIPAVCNIGDYIIVPKPCYQVYVTSPKLWGVIPYKVPILCKNKYLPILDNIPETVVKKSKMFIINYPNNPTGAEGNAEFYKEIVNFCNKRGIILVNDSAYIEIVNSGKKPVSLLQYDKGKTSIEIGTFSKTFNMTGFRIGYAVGNSKVINALLKIKSNVDSGQFMPIQYAAIKAMNLDRNIIENSKKIYDERRNCAKNILKSKNIKFYDSEATFYIWCNVPKNYTTTEFCEKLINDYGIIVTPGNSFGDVSNAYFRISVTRDVRLIKEYLCKIEQF